MYVYLQSEPGLFTVGFHDPDGRWHGDSDHPTRESAARRVALLNGSGEIADDETVDEPIEPRPVPDLAFLTQAERSVLTIVRTLGRQEAFDRLVLSGPYLIILHACNRLGSDAVAELRRIVERDRASA